MKCYANSSYEIGTARKFETENFFRILVICPAYSWIRCKFLTIPDKVDLIDFWLSIMCSDNVVIVKKFVLMVFEI